MDGPGTHTNDCNGVVPATVVIKLIYYVRIFAEKTSEGLPTAREQIFELSAILPRMHSYTLSEMALVTTSSRLAYILHHSGK